MLATTLLKQGTGTPLVFLHGFLGTSEDWRPVVSHLPACTCVGIDLPGHGKSSFTPEFSFSMENEPFHLIGYSLGGRLAMHYAKKHPEKIASLTLLSAHPGLKTEEEKKKRFEKDLYWASLLQTRPIDDFLQHWYAQPLFRTFHPNLAQRRNQNIEALTQTLLHYSLGKQIDFLPFLPSSTQVLIGQWDLNYHSLYPRYHLIEKAGHAVHLENPKSVAEEIYKQALFGVAT